MAYNKYSNKRSGSSDSKRESLRKMDLQILERAGEIRGLRHHVRFELIPAQRDANGELIERACHYEADHVYEDLEGRTVVEDSKPKIKVVPGQKKPRFTGRTPDYIIKRKLMLHVHGIRIIEV